MASMKVRGSDAWVNGTLAVVSMLQVVNLASLSFLLHDGRRQSRGHVPRSTGIGGNCKCGHPYDGCADLGLVADVGLIVSLFVLCEAADWHCLGAWMRGRRTWKAVRMVGSLAGTMAVVVSICLSHVGGESYSVVGDSGMLCLWQRRCPDLDLGI